MRTLRIALGLAAVLIGLLPGAAAAQTDPIHIPYYSAGSTDLCGVPITYESQGLFTLVYNPQTNTVTAVDDSSSALTGPTGNTLIGRGGGLQLITNVVNADGSQSYTWTLPSRYSYKLANGGVLLIQAGILKLTATVYPDGTFTSAVTLDQGQRIDFATFCDVLVAALT